MYTHCDNTGKSNFEKRHFPSYIFFKKALKSFNDPGTFKNAHIVPGLFRGCQASSELNETAPATWNIEKI
jgi:hypothetical protein